MANLGSSSCRPLLQGMILLALLLLASIQAGPVMAQWQAAEQILHGSEEALQPVLPHVGEKVDQQVAEKVPEQLAKTALASRACQKPAFERSCKGVKMGLRVHRYLCKAQGWMDKLNPGGASGTPYFVEFLGGDLLSNFRTLSCSVTSNSVVPCCSAAPQQATGATLSSYPPATMSVRITGIRVGQEEVRVPPPAYTNLESSLSAAVIRQVKALNNPWTKPISTAADKLCYAAAALSYHPRIEILLGSDNGGVMQNTELSVDATGAVWYPESFMFCLGIRTTVGLIAGTP